ncbi:response regulator transcription factor [Pararhodobacter sp. SW119]|uniref:response regulator n=1 Tax=Pararhodobacter sp. SW119 TaxID=2780075 RepID=UPI001ADF957C|nr:response regulator transcription factor [Pararhodobacter sp. SW119]
MTDVIDQPHVLICDDEPDLREMLGEYLTRRGFSATLAASAAELRAALTGAQVDAVVLDIAMPGEDGLSVLRSLRAGAERVPVLMLTAAGETIDRIIGLEMGADDYLAKPVDLRELEARIKAVLRRAVAPAPVSDAARRRWRFGRCWLDIPAAKLFDETGGEVPLTAMEFNLLRLFAENRGRVLNRDQILEGAHDRSWDPFDRSIDIRISRIRRKIETNPEKPEAIRTVRGIGYVYDPK